MDLTFSSDKATAGIWRALVVETKDNGKASVYIPALHKDQMPFNDPESPTQGLISEDPTTKELVTSSGRKLSMKLQDYPIANQCCWQVRSDLKTGDAVWVMFENGDVNYPVILGSLGKSLPGMTAGVAGITSQATGNVQYNGEYYLGMPKYELSQSAIIKLATLITGETGGSDDLSCRQEASQIANLSEVTKKRSATESGILWTAEKSGWYSPNSFSRGYTQTAIDAVKYCLVEGKRVLPRYVTEHDTFPLDILNPKGRSQYNRGDAVNNKYGAKYLFYCFFGTDQSGDIAGYTASDYELYKNDDTKVTSEQIYSSTGWQWPCKSNEITSKMTASRKHPVSGIVKPHKGIDIDETEGNPFYASKSGKVKERKYDPIGYGNYLVIDHEDGWCSLYAHASELLVSQGDRVSRGQVIGKIGSTGVATGPHLHFEVFKNYTDFNTRELIDPETLFK